MAAGDAMTNGGGTTGSSNSFNWGQGLFSLGDTALKGYFAEETAKHALKAPPANTAIVVGGIVAVGVLLLILFKF